MLLKNFIFIIIASLLSGCASQGLFLDVPTNASAAKIDTYQTQTHQRSIHNFNAFDLNKKIHQKKLEKKVDNLFVLLDMSDGMNEVYREMKLNDYAIEILNRFNLSFPDIKIKGGMTVFGDAYKSETWNIFSSKRTDPFNNLNSPILINNQLNESLFQHSIQENKLSSAINVLSEKMIEADGRSALMIISRWEHVDAEAIEAVDYLRQKINTTSLSNHSGKSICVYTVGMGNRYSRVGFDQIDNCGFSMPADRLAQPEDMAHFVERIFLSGPSDLDGDGIYDYLDQCPNTKRSRLVGFDGCNRFKEIVGSNSGDK